MKIVILDTGCANIASVKYAIDRLGYHSTITADPQTIQQSDKLLLPGVGSASFAMQELKKRDLIELITRCDQPILGICLGMQILAKQSEEGNINTLNIINQSVTKLPDYGLPLPHMGWNTVHAKAGNQLFKHIPDEAYFYFVHGYALPPCEATTATTQYGCEFSAAVQKENYFGVQFHPERSGKAGAQLLKNFLEI